MKILLLSPLPPPAGGIASWTKRYLQTPQAKENDVYVVNTAIIGKRAGQLSKLSLIEEFQRTWGILKNLKHQLIYNCPDIVHLNTPCSKLGLIRDYLCASMIKRTSAKLLVHCRCDVTYMVNSKLGEFFYNKLINLADSVITLNTASQRFTKDICQKDSCIIPNFISEMGLYNLNTKHKVNPSVTNIIYAGHITKMKGSDLILKVAEYFPHIKFTLVGYLSEEIKLLTKPDNVVYTGELSKEQVIEEMKKADLYIFPTLTEGFPNALLEAMACGLPIVTTEVGAIPDMIEENGGISIKIGDVTGFVNAIKLLDSDLSKREKMSSWNIDKVNRCYTEEHIMNLLFSSYEQLIL